MQTITTTTVMQTITTTTTMLATTTTTKTLTTTTTTTMQQIAKTLNNISLKDVFQRKTSFI